jgi:hypothetical protein
MKPGICIGKGGVVETEAYNEIGDKDAKDRDTPQGIDEVDAFSGLNG